MHYRLWYELVPGQVHLYEALQVQTLQRSIMRSKIIPPCACSPNDSFGPYPRVKTVRLRENPKRAGMGAAGPGSVRGAHGRLTWTAFTPP